MPISSFL